MLTAVTRTLAFIASLGVDATPLQAPRLAYDIQGHRGGRGNVVESTLPAFASGLLNGVRTLELDNGITKDGVVVVWHDENIVAEKCNDTRPAFPNDPMFPYVGQFVANLTFAQLRTLDCGSKRQSNFLQQLTYPNTRISTLKEVFDFATCADPAHQIHWNIESKINAQNINQTRSVDDFVTKQHAVFKASPYYRSITYQSFDWRTLVGMKKLDKNIVTSALIDPTTISGNATAPDDSLSPWLAGLRLDTFGGAAVPVGVKIARAAASLGFDLVSPAAGVGSDPSAPGWNWFTTKEMVDEAHLHGLQVKPWTVNSLNVVEQLVRWKADGIITDYPDVVRRWAIQQNIGVASPYGESRVRSCLKKALAAQQK